jgi:hypothetical protein
MEYLIKTNSLGMTEEQFFRFCQENDGIKFERSSIGELILAEPAGSYTSSFNLEITASLALGIVRPKRG